MLRLTTASSGRDAELIAMTHVQPLIRQIDTGIGHVGQVAAGFSQIRLTSHIAPDNPHLLPVAEAPQHARQAVLVIAADKGLGQYRAQLPFP